MLDIVEAGQSAECAICELLIEEGGDIVLMDGWWCHAECVATFVGPTDGERGHAMCATSGCGAIAVVHVDGRAYCEEHRDGRTRSVWRNLSFGLMSQMNARRCVAWHGPDWKSPDDQWTAADWSNAMAGEAGEAANVVKKLRRLECTFPSTVPSLQREELLAMLADELADVVLYADLLAQKLDIDLGHAVRLKFNRKSHEQGFEERI